MDGDVSFEVSLLLNAVAQGEPEAGSKTTWLKEVASSVGPEYVSQDDRYKRGAVT